VFKYSYSANTTSSNACRRLQTPVGGTKYMPRYQ
jgi:hypothetical protein